MAGGKRKRKVVVFIITAVVLLGGGAAGAYAWIAGRAPEEPVPRAEAGVIEHPLTPAQQLVADADDPQACAVTFSGEGAPADPMLQSQAALYQNLPIPAIEGKVFAGCYPTAAAAAALICSCCCSAAYSCCCC